MIVLTNIYTTDCISRGRGEEEMRRSGICKKGLVIGIIMLFILLGSVPNTGAKTNKNSNTNSTFILSENTQKQPLGIIMRWYLYAKVNITVYCNCTFLYTPMGNDFYNVFITSEDMTHQNRLVCKINYEPYFLLSFKKTYHDFFACNIMYLKNPKTNLTTPNDPDGGYIEGDAILLHIPRF
jgi:hypothetical protein